MNEYEKLRVLHRPEVVRLLLIGEAPPRTLGTFFYSQGSQIARYTEKAFFKALGLKKDAGSDFLDQFKNYGFFLDDVCHTPISRSERTAAIKHALPEFTKRLKELSPKAVVVFVKAVLPDVLQALNESGREGVRVSLVPFPGQGHQARYVKAMTEEIRRAVTPKETFIDLKRAYRSRFELGKDFDGVECVLLRVQYVGYEVVQHLYFGTAASDEKLKQTAEFLDRTGWNFSRYTTTETAFAELKKHYGPSITGFTLEQGVPHPVTEIPYPAIYCWWESG